MDCLTFPQQGSLHGAPPLSTFRVEISSSRNTYVSASPSRPVIAATLECRSLFSSTFRQRCRTDDRTRLPSLDVAGKSLVRRKNRHSQPVRASAKDVPEFKGFPPMQTKPAFYWRLLAVLPYINPLWLATQCSETANGLQPFLLFYDELTMPLFYFMCSLPAWFGFLYFILSFLGIVRNNRFPHFLRFHVITGMLLEIFMQVLVNINDWVPSGVYWGKLGQHFWLATCLAYIFITVECIISALKGMYADVPFISDAAYMQIPYE